MHRKRSYRYPIEFISYRDSKKSIARKMSGSDHFFLKSETGLQIICMLARSVLLRTCSIDLWWKIPNKHSKEVLVKVYKNERRVLVMHAFPHLSVEPAARTRRKLPSTAADRSFRRPSPSSSSVFASVFVALSSSFLPQGCHVAPTLSDMHMVEIGPCPTVRSKDMNPSNINSSPHQKKKKKKENNYQRKFEK